MMIAWLELLCVLMILADFHLLGSSRLGACIRTAARQAMLLSALPLLMVREEFSWRIVLIALASVVVRGFLMPHMLDGAARAAGARRELVPFVRFTPSLLIGAVLLGLCFWIARPLELEAAGASWLLLPAVLFTMLTGLFIIVARKTAVMQALGYLVMENGIFAFGIAFAAHEPLLVELGVLLDVFAAIFIMGITIHHISREFDHVDTALLSNLKD